MSEHDANKWLLDSAALREQTVDPLAETQRMPVYERRRRMAEARDMYGEGFRKPDFRDDQPAADYPTQAARRGFTDE